MARVAIMIGSQDGKGTVMTFLMRLDDMLVDELSVCMDGIACASKRPG